MSYRLKEDAVRRLSFAAFLSKVEVDRAKGSLLNHVRESLVQQLMDRVAKDMHTMDYDEPTRTFRLRLDAVVLSRDELHSLLHEVYRQGYEDSHRWYP